MNSKQLQYSLFFLVLGALFFIPFNGGVHLFDWDEINFAEISREMLLTQNFTRVYIDFAPFWEKPPLFFWLQTAAMNAVGVNEFAARLPNAIVGIATLVVLFNIGRTLYDNRFGFIWAGVYFGTILPFLYSKSGIIDPWFNFFIFLGIYYFILFYWKKDRFGHIKLPFNQWTYLFIGGFFIGLAILTKGQVAYLIASITFFVYWVDQRFRFYVNVPEFLFFTLAATLVTLGWYGIETWKNGPWFINEFNKYQYRLFSTPDAGHRGFPGYHFIVLLVGCFPASIFTIRNFWRMPNEQYAYQADFKKWMKYLFWVVLILFTIVKSKIVHYSSMCYFPLTFLAANTIWHLMNEKIAFKPWMRNLLYTVGGLFVFATVTLPFIGMNVESIIPLINDPFAQANLEADVNWTVWQIIPGIFLLALMIFSVSQIMKDKKQVGLMALFGGVPVFVMLTLFFYIGRIESISQRAAVEFFESLEGKDAYVMTMGYKSYAHLFYTKKPYEKIYPSGKEAKEERKRFMLTGPVDKDVYLVTKIHKTDEVKQYSKFEEIGRKNGFVFYKRPKQTE
ncbi:MAG: glycosyltransferase family 39 protein [Saprospiraceae bacterium]|nr:glycosyltransferase family 39 protein [Saprospiraceae bacterium]